MAVKSNTSEKFNRWTKIKSNYLTQKIDYDNIVDKSHFRTTAEIKRDAIAEGKIGAGTKGLYDYQEGEEIAEERARITELELLLRAGKLDKADVQKLKEMFNDKAEKDIAEKRTEEALKAENKAQKNRTEALDKILGTNQNTETQ